ASVHDSVGATRIMHLAAYMGLVPAAVMIVVSDLGDTPDICMSRHIVAALARPAKRDELGRGTGGTGATAGRRRGPEAPRHRAAEPARKPHGGGNLVHPRLARGRRNRGQSLPGTARRDRRPQRADGPAAGRGRPRRLPAAVARWSARRIGAFVYAD